MLAEAVEAVVGGEVTLDGPEKLSPNVVMLAGCGVSGAAMLLEARFQCVELTVKYTRVI